MGVEVPHELRGLWKREVITAPGFRDETTQVVWLQTRSWYADLRVPADRPSRPGADGFAAFSDADLIACAKVQGFAGQLTVADGVCYWRRDLDYQPPSSSPDEGRYSVSGDVMIEDGIHADYQEIWRRAPEGTDPAGVFRREAEDGRPGLLVIGGRYLIEVVTRFGPVSQAASLTDAVESALAAGDRRAAEALLSTRIRFAERDQAGRWTTVLSSLPWLQGRPTWKTGAVRFDADAGVLTTAFGEEGDHWRLIDATGPAGELAGWLGALEASALGMTS